jgi:predicted ATPase
LGYGPGPDDSAKGGLASIEVKAARPMIFDKLRLAGFKSFCDQTDFKIEAGLTGIVGPNGCGKSNLVEALRWVMGENSYKSMRASGMDDVIFAGATSPKSASSSTIPTGGRPPPSTMPK